MNNISILKKYGYLWITLFLFVFSLVGHWIADWYIYLHEQLAHQQPIEVNE